MSRHITGPVPSGAHGHNGYTNYGCRCDDCRAGQAEYQKAYRSRASSRFASGEVDAPHGSRSTYTNYGCRCDECREAMRAAGPRRLRKRGPNADGGVLAALRPPGGWGSYTVGES